MTDYDSFDLIKALLEKVEDLAKENGRLCAMNTVLEGELYKTRDELAEVRASKSVAMGYQQTALQNPMIDLVAICLRDPNAKIGQIKAVREATGLYLKEAKEIVAEAWYRANKPWNF
jgi:ribosomal protein L7/L12